MQVYVPSWSGMAGGFQRWYNSSRSALRMEMKQRAIAVRFVFVDSWMAKKRRLMIKIPTAGIMPGAIGVALLAVSGWLAIGEYREEQRMLMFHGFFSAIIWAFIAITLLSGAVVVSIAAIRWVKALRCSTKDE